MNGAVKPRVKSSPSSSGMRPRLIAPTNNAKPAVDDEFSAFFDRGDAGDYQQDLLGAPASIDPITYDEHRSQREPVSRDRHAFLSKVVASVVAACAALLLLAVGLKSISARASMRATGQGARQSQHTSRADSNPGRVTEPERSASTPIASAAPARPLPPITSELQVQPPAPAPDTAAREPTTASEIPKTPEPLLQKSTRSDAKRQVVRRNTSVPAIPRGTTSSKPPESTGTPNPARPSVAAFPVE